MPMSTFSSSTWNWPSAPRTCSCSSLKRGSVVIARHERAALADQEVEVGALVGLLHMVEVELPVAARQMGLRLFPALLPARELLLGHEQVQPSLGHVELDQVTVLDQGE